MVAEHESVPAWQQVARPYVTVQQTSVAAVDSADGTDDVADGRNAVAASSPAAVPAPRAAAEPATEPVTEALTQPTAEVRTEKAPAVPEPTISAHVFNPPPLSDEDLEQEIRRLSGGRVATVKPDGPYFGDPYHVQLLNLALMVPALRWRDRTAITGMSVGWMACFVNFWLWWLTPANRTGWSGLVLNSLILFYVTAIPLYFLLSVSWLRRPDPARPVPPLRVAFIVTKAPSEPWETARRTLTLMLAQNYPHPYDVWIADEAPSEETLIWCARHGVKVSTRQGVDAYHRATWPRRTKCKEGNLAYFYDALGYRNYDVVAQLDCDHVPEPGYLAAMVRPFADPAVGYVAAPSVCDANAEASWSARGRLYREAVWHGPVQLGHNGGLAPVCIGSHYAVRTQALREIGGIGPELAEDFSTSFLLNSAGWQGAFAIDAEAHGDGPMTFADTLTQEFQWSRSLTMVLFGLVPAHLRRMRGLLKTRFGFSLAYYPISSAVISAGLLLPPLAVLTGIQWVHVSYPSFILHLASVSVWLLLLLGLLRRRGLLRPATAPVLAWENWLFTLTGWPYVVRGVVAGIIGVIRPKPVTFKVTPKGMGGMPSLPTKLMAPYLGITLSLSAVAIYGEVADQVIGYIFLCLLSSMSYAFVSVLVPLLHIREAARSAGVRRRAGFPTARLPLTLGLLTFLPLGFAVYKYIPHIVVLLER